MVFTILKNIKNKVLLLFGICLIIFAIGYTTKAASLSISPNSGQYGIGVTFTVNILVSSADQSINVVSGEINFDASKLEVVSLAKTGSVVGLWVQEPHFSNVLGTVNFEGVILNPGFFGSNGKIISIIFKTKNPGTTKLLLSNASVLANDGEGTDVLNNLIHANFVINGSTVVTEPLANTSTKPKTTTTIKKIVTTTTTKLNNDLTDNCKLIAISEIPREKSTDPNVKFNIQVNSVDLKIDHYAIKIDNGEAIVWDNSISNIYQVPKLKPGGHIIEVLIFTENGEMLSAKKGFVIQSLRAPIWKRWFKKVISGDSIMLEGMTEYPSSEVIISVRKKIQSSFGLKKLNISDVDNVNRSDVEYFKVITDEKGDFSLDLTNKIRKGIYFVSANVIDNNGGMSNNSFEQEIEVIGDSWIETGGMSELINCMIAMAIILFVAVAIIISHRWYYKSMIKKQIYGLGIEDIDNLKSMLVSIDKKMDKYINTNGKQADNSIKINKENIQKDIQNIKSMLNNQDLNQ